MSVSDHFRQAKPDLSDSDAFTALVAGYLRQHPDLIERWQGYVDDKRTTPTPFMDLRGPDVGYMDTRGERRNVHRYDEHAAVCAAFILRESLWVLRRRYLAEAVDDESATRVSSSQPGTETLPQFRYHSDPIATGSLVERTIICVCCGEARRFAYTGPTYGANQVEQNSLCPWCIADGSAAERLEVVFTDVANDVQVDESALTELATRTPGYVAWQQDRWCYHCGDACDYRGRVGAAELAELSSRATLAVRSALNEWAPSEKERDELLLSLHVDGDLTAYLFRCLACNDSIARCDAS